MDNFLEHPTGELLIEVQKSFNEDLKTRDRDLEAIKEWLKKQPHLPDTWDDGRIMTYLRGCNFSLEKCKRKLDMYFTMKTLVPEFYNKRDANQPELQEIANLNIGATLPGLTPDGRRVTVGRVADINFDTPEFANIAKAVLMLGDIRLGLEKTGVSGDIYILDASVVIFKHYTKVSPIVIKKFLVCVQEAYPVKLKAVHVINATPLVDTIIKVVTPFLKDKIRKRIFVHPNLESLYKAVPKENLPEELGGTGGSLGALNKLWFKILQEYAPWFKEQENVKSDESKRPGKPTNYEDLFGLDGSFKQLSID